MPALIRYAIPSALFFAATIGQAQSFPPPSGRPLVGLSSAESSRISAGEAAAIRTQIYPGVYENRGTFRLTLPANVPQLTVSVQAFVMRQGLQIFLSNPVEFTL